MEHVVSIADHPVDNIEPEIAHHDAYRDAALKFTRVLNASMQYMGATILRAPIDDPYIREIKTAYWHICYALGLQMCDGKTMTKCAEELGIERATISKGATTFCRANQLPPSFYMKSESAPKAYQKARISSIKRCNSKSKAA